MAIGAQLGPPSRPPNLCHRHTTHPRSAHVCGRSNEMWVSCSHLPDVHVRTRRSSPMKSPACSASTSPSHTAQSIFIMNSNNGASSRTRPIVLYGHFDTTQCQSFSATCLGHRGAKSKNLKQALLQPIHLAQQKSERSRSKQLQ